MTTGFWAPKENLTIFTYSGTFFLGKMQKYSLFRERRFKGKNLRSSKFNSKNLDSFLNCVTYFRIGPDGVITYFNMYHPDGVIISI